jgi:acetyl-CoA carboxylase carboxyl transferase subunit alpha
MGGAHRRPEEAIAALGRALGEELDDLSRLSRDQLLQERRAKFLAIG